MDRRTVLAGVGTALAGLAGCASDSPERSGQTPGDLATTEATPVPMRFPDYSFEEGADGQTVVVMTLKNPGAETRRTEMIVYVQGPDQGIRMGTTDIEVGPGEEKIYRVTFDVEWSWFKDNRNLADVQFQDQ